MTANLRGILLMVAAMAGFAAADSLIKIASRNMPTGQVILLIGVLSTPIFAVWSRVLGASLWSVPSRSRVLWLRCLADMVGALGFISALATIPLSTATAVLQAAPILVMAGAALVLRERVGRLRWMAAGIGFIGMLIILQPGPAGFDARVLWAVLGVAGLAARDLITRRMPRGIATTTVATWATGSQIVLGALMLAVSGGAVVPAPAAILPVAGIVAFGVASYWAMVEATRAGDVSAIAPFRYSRLIFGVALSVLIFDERLTGAMIAGSVLIVGSGLFILMRERRLALSRPPV